MIRQNSAKSFKETQVIFFSLKKKFLSTMGGGGHFKEIFAGL